MKQEDPKEEKGRGRQRPESGRQQGRGDFWDRIANDVAGGYGAQGARSRDILNPDQLPDDARRGDA